MIVDFKSWPRRVLVAGMISGLAALPHSVAAQATVEEPAAQGGTAQATAGETATQNESTPAAAQSGTTQNAARGAVARPARIEASQAALALFQADPRGFLVQTGDLPTLIASVVLADISVVDQLVSLASEEGVSPAQGRAIGAGLALAAVQLTNQGNIQQGAAILAAAAQSSSVDLASGFASAAGDVQTAATPDPGAGGGSVVAPGGSPAGPAPASISDNGASIVTSSEPPTGSTTGGANFSAGGSSGSGGTISGGIASAAVSPTG